MSAKKSRICKIVILHNNAHRGAGTVHSKDIHFFACKETNSKPIPSLIVGCTPSGCL